VLFEWRALPYFTVPRLGASGDAAPLPPPSRDGQNLIQTVDVGPSTLLPVLLPSRLRGGDGDLASPCGAERTRACRAAFDASEAPESGGMRVRRAGHGAAPQHCEALRRRVTERAFGTDFIGPRGFFAIVFEVADQTAATDADENSAGNA
jgi:hypothetical protein